MSALDDVWVRAAARVGVPVERGGEAYVHFDGRVLHVCGDEHLDADDTLAQLVLHELCHALVEGPARRHVPDWGLDNTTDADAVRERAAVRLQAHLLGAWALRAHLYPTTEVRAFFESLGRDALATGGVLATAGVAGRIPDDGSAALARAAAREAAEEPFATALDEALEASARLLGGGARHRASGAPLGVDDGARCGDCAWRSAGGRCRHARSALRVAVDERACARFETAVDCHACGACCRSAYGSVPVAPRDLVRRRHPALIVVRDEGYRELARRGDRCVALDGPPGGPFACTLYEDRPRACRDFAAAGRHCLDARVRVGLSLRIQTAR